MSEVCFITNLMLYVFSFSTRNLTDLHLTLEGEACLNLPAGAWKSCLKCSNGLNVKILNATFPSFFPFSTCLFSCEAKVMSNYRKLVLAHIAFMDFFFFPVLQLCMQNLSFGICLKFSIA